MHILRIFFVRDSVLYLYCAGVAGLLVLYSSQHAASLLEGLLPLRGCGKQHAAAGRQQSQGLHPLPTSLIFFISGSAVCIRLDMLLFCQPCAPLRTLVHYKYLPWMNWLCCWVHRETGMCLPS
jgi:hypothetical protein